MIAIMLHLRLSFLTLVSFRLPPLLGTYIYLEIVPSVISLRLQSTKHRQTSPKNRLGRSWLLEGIFEKQKICHNFFSNWNFCLL